MKKILREIEEYRRIKKSLDGEVEQEKKKLWNENKMNYL